MKEIWIGMGVAALAIALIFGSLFGYSKYKASQKAWADSQVAWAQYNAKYGNHPDAAKTPQELLATPQASSVVGALNNVTARAGKVVEDLKKETEDTYDECTIGNLRTINTAQTSFHASSGRYARNYAELSRFLAGQWSPLVLKCNHFIDMTGGDKCYAVVALPNGSGNAFYTDCSAVIRIGTNESGRAVN